MKKMALGFLAAFAGGTVSPPSLADYPDKPIRLVVPAAAGGSTDLGARVVAARLGQILNVPVVVENKGGGGGRIGAAYVAEARPDGYTLLYGNSITNALLPAAAGALQYDAEKDFVPVGKVFLYSTIIACNLAVPYSNVKEMVDYGRQNPEKIVMATAGVGSGNHFSSALFSSEAAIKVLHVPYKGNAPAMQDVVAGRASCIHATEVNSYLDAKKLKAIATTGLERDPRYPNVPTVSEAGLAGYDVTWWQAIFAPAGTSKDVVSKLAAGLKQVAEDPSVAEKMQPSGFSAAYASPDALTQTIHKDTEKFREIAKEAGISME